MGIADEDRGCTPEHQQALRDALEVYVGAHHAFAIPDHSVYYPEAAERHWGRGLDLFGEELGAGGC